MRKIYGVFSKGKFGLTTSKKTALDYVKKHGGQVRWLVDNGSESWDAPTFMSMSRALDIQFKRVSMNPVRLHHGTFISGGRKFKTIVFRTVKSTNKFLEKHPEYGVIGEKIKQSPVRGFTSSKTKEIHVALNSDNGKKI